MINIKRHFICLSLIQEISEKKIDKSLKKEEVKNQEKYRILFYN